MAFHEYPYTDFHELNLDWVIKKVKELATAWAQVQQDWTDEQAAFANLQNWIENYFNNLNVQTEINLKLDAMVLAGTMSELIAPYVASGLPAEVADQIGAVVAAQIGPVVAAQIGAVVADQLPAIAATAAATEVGTWLSTHIDPDTGYVIDDTLTVSLAAADAKTVGDKVTEIKSALTKTIISNHQYLADAIRDNGHYYTYNSDTGIISKSSNANLSAFEFDIKAGTYYYGQLYGASFIKDLTTQTVTTVPNATSGFQSIVIAHDSTAYISVGNSLYDVASFFADTPLVVGMYDFPQGEFGIRLTDTMQANIEEGIEYVYQYNNNGNYDKLVTLSEGDVVTVKSIAQGDAAKTISVKGIKADNTYVELFMYFHEGEWDNLYIDQDFIGLRFVCSAPTGTGKFSLVKRTELWKAIYNKPVFYCGASREIKKLKDAIYIATRYLDSTLYVDAGTYDLIDEFGASYFANLTSGNTSAGLILSKRIHVVFSPNSIVTSHYTGDNQYAMSLYSPFNATTGGFILENMTLDASRARYAIHDEQNGKPEQCTSKLINCKITFDNSDNPHWNTECAIGGGLGANHEVDISGCLFSGTVYYHLSNAESSDHCCGLRIHNNYFIKHTVTLQMTRSDASRKTDVVIDGNSFPYSSNATDQGIEIYDVTSTMVDIYAWNNIMRPQT